MEWKTIEPKSQFALALDTHLHAEPLLLCIILEFLFMALLE